MQRKAFKEEMQKELLKHPDWGSELKEKFTADTSKFKSMSDDLLQFVCGKRSEILEARRKPIEPSNKQAAQVLKNIPPSETHVFDEAQVKEIFSQRDFQFRGSFRRTARKPLSAREGENKYPRSVSGPSRPRKPVKRPGSSFKKGTKRGESGRGSRERDVGPKRRRF